MISRLITIALLAVSLAAAPASGPSAIPLEVKANAAFTNGQYALALPLLQKVAEQYKSEPEKLGPVQEQIKVCQTQLAQANATESSARAEVDDGGKRALPARWQRDLGAEMDALAGVLHVDGDALARDAAGHPLGPRRLLSVDILLGLAQDLLPPATPLAPLRQAGAVEPDEGIGQGLTFWKLRGIR